MWTAVNKKTAGILAWVVGDRSSDTFEILWSIVQGWQSFWYATDGYAVYAKFIHEISHIVSKTYMTRVEGENIRLRHDLARLHRKTLCDSKLEEMLEASLRWGSGDESTWAKSRHLNRISTIILLSG